MTSLVGQPAPLFQVRSDDGVSVSTAGLLGRWAALFFFARALDPASLLQARRFEVAADGLGALGAQVVGVGADTEAHLALLRERCGLTYPLLPDAARTLAEQYGVGRGWAGRLGRGQRQTFLISPQGQVAWHWPRVDPASHADEVRQTLERLMTGTAPYSAGRPA